MFKQYTVPIGTKLDDAAFVAKVVKWNEDQNLARLNRLENYYLGDHEILTRDTNSGTNNKIVVNHAKYITDTNISYLLGNPVDYSANGGKDPKTGKQNDAPDIEPITDEYKSQTINDLDTEIAKDVSIFGYQYEYLYADEEANPRSRDIDNRHIVLIRDNTMVHNKLGAIIYDPIYDEKGKKITSWNITIVDSTNVTKYTAQGEQIKTLVADGTAKTHGFGAVPVIEYKNNPEFQGDFEQVIPLIDAYNTLQSDRVNDVEQLVDAILAFTEMDFTEDQAATLRTSRMIANIPKDGKVEFITKQLDASGIEQLRKDLETDIHKISMTPNMTDENFIGNSSGVAILYKLLAFEQNIKNKERYLERGLMERFKLYNNFLKLKSNMQEIKITDVDAIFKRNLPRNDVEISQMINNLQGIVDDATLISQLSFVKNAKETIDKVAEQEASKTNVNDITATPTSTQDANNPTDVVAPAVDNPTPTPTPAAGA